MSFTKVTRAFGGIIPTIGLVMAPGCGNGSFLGLEDYQRDLLFAAAVWFSGQSPDDGAAGDPTVGEPVPGRDGTDGLDCWDLNGNGEPDRGEDTNGDGVFDALDCQGAPGTDGRAGSTAMTTSSPVWRASAGSASGSRPTRPRARWR